MRPWPSRSVRTVSQSLEPPRQVGCWVMLCNIRWSVLISLRDVVKLHGRLLWTYSRRRGNFLQRVVDIVPLSDMLYDQWMAYLFTTRCWSFRQRDVIGQCLQRVVIKSLRVVVYASTSTTAFHNCTCIVHVVHSVDTRSQRPAQHTGLYIELVAAISTVFCRQNNNNVIITAPAVSLCVVAARSCCGAEELESSRQRDTLHQTIIVVDVARVYRL